MKNFWQKYIPVSIGDLSLDPDSFRDETIWERIIEYSNKEWEKGFNEQYIMHLLTNFDSEKLIFNKKVVDNLAQ